MNNGATFTLAATLPLNGLRATVIGSRAGLSAVPQPVQSPFKLWDLGKSLPYTQAIASRGSKSETLCRTAHQLISGSVS